MDNNEQIEPAEAISVSPPVQSPPPEEPPQPQEETWDDIPDDIKGLNTDEILARVRLLENDIKVVPL